MKKLLFLLFFPFLPLPLLAQQVINTNILLSTTPGNPNDAGPWYYTTNLIFAGGTTGYTNAAGIQLYKATNCYSGCPSWIIETNGTAPEDYLNVNASGTWFTGYASSPPPTISFPTLNVFTNWSTVTSNFWFLPGDSVSFTASGYDLDWLPATNQLQIVLDGSNLLFNGPWTSGGRTLWTVAGSILWDGSNFWSTGILRSGDTNTPTWTDTEECTNIQMGTNHWSFTVLGDTNALTFLTHTITAARLPTNDLPTHTQ